MTTVAAGLTHLLQHFAVLGSFLLQGKRRAGKYLRETADAAWFLLPFFTPIIPLGAMEELPLQALPAIPITENPFDAAKASSVLERIKQIELSLIKDRAPDLQVSIPKGFGFFSP